MRLPEVTDADFHIVFCLSGSPSVPSAYPIYQSNSFAESDNKLLILKGSLFSAHGLGLGDMGRGAESIRQFREYWL